MLLAREWIDRLLADTLGMSSGESLAVVSDRPDHPIARAIAGHVLVAADDDELASMLPPCDVVIAASDGPLIHSALRRRLGEAGMRVAIIRAMSEESLARCACDVETLRARAERVVDSLRGVTELRFGELVVELKPSPPIVNCGDLRMRGSTGYLPAGEVYLSPASCDGEVIVDDSITLTIRDRTIVRIDGGDDARRLERRLRDAPREMALVTELGFGVNPHARLSGNPAEDVKVAGMAHLGFGDDTFMGGDVAIGMHWDALFPDRRRP